jgi:tetratricopeptide (TPR) repeat protein
MLKEAEDQLLKGAGFCERLNINAWNAWAQAIIGEIYFDMGDFHKSKEHYKKGCSLFGRNGFFPSFLGLAEVGFARSKVMNKEKDVNLESLYDRSRNNRIKATEGWVARLIGEILLNIDDQHVSEAENWIQKALEADKGNGAVFQLGNDYALYADLFKRKGDRIKARENTGKAIEILRECGADGWVSKYEQELALLS